MLEAQHKVEFVMSEQSLKSFWSRCVPPSGRKYWKILDMRKYYAFHSTSMPPQLGAGAEEKQGALGPPRKSGCGDR